MALPIADFDCKLIRLASTEVFTFEFDLPIPYC